MALKATGLTAVLLATASMASAQEITLRTADSLPVDHYIFQATMKPMMDKAAELSGGAIKYEHFPAQQLGKAKDMLSLAQTGVTDIAYVGASYISDKLPLSSVGELPEAFASSCEGTLAFWEIAKPGGVLEVAEYQPEGVRVLAALVLPPYEFYSKTPIEGLASLQGQKVRSTGGAQQIALEKLGAVPVQMAAPEAREALSRGTVDGIVFATSSVLAYDLVPHLKFATKGANFGAFVATYMISQSKFDSLPEDQQQALTEAGEYATKEGCKTVDEATATDGDKIAEGGVEFAPLPEEDAAKLVETMATVSDEWAAELDGRGKPGSDVLAAFREALKNGM